MLASHRRRPRLKYLKSITYLIIIINFLNLFWFLILLYSAKEGHTHDGPKEVFKCEPSATQRGQVALGQLLGQGLIRSFGQHSWHQVNSYERRQGVQEFSQEKHVSRLGYSLGQGRRRGLQPLLQWEGRASKWPWTQWKQVHQWSLQQWQQWHGQWSLQWQVRIQKWFEFKWLAQFEIKWRPSEIILQDWLKIEV